MAAPCLTAGAYVLELLQGFDRGEYPHWADSLSIPLMTAPVVLVILLAWSAAHLAFLRGTYRSVPLTSAVSSHSNKWLLFVSAIAVFLVIDAAVYGAYWYVIAGIAWLYFYLSLAAARSASFAPEEPGSE